MSYRSPLARARGLGPAREGVGHWWLQRLTAIALVPLVVFLVVALALLGKADYQTMVAWVSSPLVSILLIALAIALFYHSSLGIQVVLEDYISTKWLRLCAIMLVNFMNILLAIVSIFAVLKITFGIAQ